jgi:hypothetical protein
LHEQRRRETTIFFKKKGYLNLCIKRGRAVGHRKLSFSSSQMMAPRFIKEISAHSVAFVVFLRGGVLNFSILK